MSEYFCPTVRSCATPMLTSHNIIESRRCIETTLLVYVRQIPMKKLLFWKKMLCSGNLILCRLSKCCDARIFALAAKYHIEPHDVVRSSVARIKNSFWFYFSELD